MKAAEYSAFNKEIVVFTRFATKRKPWNKQRYQENFYLWDFKHWLTLNVLKFWNPLFDTKTLYLKLFEPMNDVFKTVLFKEEAYSPNEENWILNEAQQYHFLENFQFLKWNSAGSKNSAVSRSERTLCFWRPTRFCLPYRHIYVLHNTFRIFTMKAWKIFM